MIYFDVCARPRGVRDLHWLTGKHRVGGGRIVQEIPFEPPLSAHEDLLGVLYCLVKEDGLEVAEYRRLLGRFHNGGELA